MLNVKRDLIGKTITGVIAVPGNYRSEANNAGRLPSEIWMLQFSDGSHVEFVSPSAKRGLRRSARGKTTTCRVPQPSPQMALNVA